MIIKITIISNLNSIYPKGFENGIELFLKEIEPEKTPKIIDRLTIINNVITRDGKVDRTKASTLKQGDPATFYVSHFSKKSPVHKGTR